VSDLSINNRSLLPYMQALVNDLMMQQELANAKTYNDVIEIISRYFREYYLNVGKPFFNIKYPNSGGLPIVDDYNYNCNAMFMNLVILFEEYQNLANLLVDYFNYRQTEKNRLMERIRYNTGICTDLVLMANTENPNNTTYIKDTFTNTNNIDLTFTDPSMRAYISTREGVLTLTRTSSINRSMNSEVTMIQGNGDPGNYHIAVIDGNTFKYISENNSHDDIVTILDDNPNTWYEYQAVNFSSSDKTSLKYDMEWAKGSKTNDLLRVRILVDLKDIYDINWITINPYNPPGSSGKVVVHSIKTSNNGIDYTGLYNDLLVLNSELNQTPQTYLLDEIIVDDYTPSKFAGQGVWSFETRPTRYIEIVMDQPESYDETVGHTYYERVVTSNDISTTIRIPENEASQQAIDGPPGKYIIDNATYINKGIDMIDGWRYCIGIRDIGVYSYTFSNQSEMVTKTFSTDRSIKKVLLYSNEKLPPSFLANLNEVNKWITYSISVDGGNKWYPISPMHRRPAGDEKAKVIPADSFIELVNSGEFERLNYFPPKEYEFNPKDIPATRTALYKGYVNTDKPPTTIRLKMKLTRPNDLATITPLIEDYSLKIYFEEVL